MSRSALGVAQRRVAALDDAGPGDQRERRAAADRRPTRRATVRSLATLRFATPLSASGAQVAERQRLARGAPRDERRADEAAEERMAVERPRLELGMELARR